MKIFPAIDIKDKKCVRLLKGNFENKKVYDLSPLDQAKKYKDFGFNYIHIVDLDGALKGETVNLNIIEEIIKSLNIKIEVGGGIRSIENLKNYIDIGVDKVIIGSAAVKNKHFLSEACNKFKDQIVLGLDAKNGFIAISGWKEETKLKALDFVSSVNNYDLSRINNNQMKVSGAKLVSSTEKSLSFQIVPTTSAKISIFNML